MPLGKLDLDAWMNGDLKPPFKLRRGETVRVVIDGKAVIGKVVHPLSKTGNPEYLIDLETGDSVGFKQSQLESLDDG
jgi:hypothetical protein